MSDKYVLISGAAGGIGKASTLFLADNGFIVFAADKDTEALKSLKSEQIIQISLDITDQQSIDRAVKKIRKTTDKLHGLVNLAGTFDHFALAEVESATFRKLIDVNFSGQQQLTQSVFPMIQNAKGRIVNLSSETVLALMPLQAYGFSKKLMDVWNTQLRMELQLLDMHVIAIRAGGHQTPFIRQSFDALAKTDGLADYRKLKEKIRQQGQKLLAKKMADPRDVAKTIYRALNVKKPKKYYNVNVSYLFRLLSLIPEGLREKLFNYQLKRWM